MPDSTSFISCAAYAKHRGVSKMAVSEAIKAGRLVKSVTRDEYGSPKIADAALADQEWDANTDVQRRLNAGGGVERSSPVLVAGPPAPMRGTVDVAPTPEGPRRKKELHPDTGAELIASSTQRMKAAQADLAELKRDAEQGLLVPAKDVKHRLIEIFTACKTRLLAIPSRARQELPQLSTADVLVIEKLVREALDDLAEGST